MRESDLFSFYTDMISSTLATPAGAAAILVLMGLFLCGFTIERLRWWYLVGLLYATTLPVINGVSTFSVLAPPLQQLRQYARPLSYACILLMLAPLVMSTRGWRRQMVGLPLLLFFVFEAGIAVRSGIFGNDVRGVLSVATFVLLLLTVGGGVSRWLQSIEDFYKALWCINVAGALVMLGTIYQLVVNKSSIIAGSRLTGITGNPQYFGIVIAYTLPVACYLLTRASARLWVRPVLITQVAVTVLLLMWTGSRTGALSLACALLVLFHRRMGRLLIFGVVVFALVLVALPYVDGVAEIAPRLLSSQNTRADVWAIMIDDIKESPWVGVSRESFEVHESSYLAMVGQFGIIGTIPFAIGFIVLIYQLLRLQTLRARFGSERGLIDVVAATWVAIGVSSAFEGVLIGVMGFPIVMIYFCGSLTSFLVDSAQEQEIAEEPAIFPAEWPTTV